ncbi:amino acid permease [Actinoplanes sp. TRM 88003]|uniref:Amino acid permease n=1 Tax=Paractinoplanes aksuensis TaxID=2939490 RepID=A0ABT1E0W0_9ACTN|nr:amino acid permease [Actinoplanes aksuensis]MCO8276789.1 amino acid permease [Actinoplanes aksuensis]
MLERAQPAQAGRRGVALYVGALLGPGLLVLPGLAAGLAGPASILAWAGLLALSGLFAVVFAALGVALPGGVAGYARSGLGPAGGRVAQWCFRAGVISGAPVVCLMGAGYVAGPLELGRGGTVLIAGLLLVTALGLTSRGLHSSTTVQFLLVTVLLLGIAVAVVGALPSADAAHFTPFAPHGWASIGSAAMVLMLSFVGWEAIASLTGHFADPRRDLPRVIAVAFLITAVIYLALATVTVAALGPAAATDVPMAALFAFSLGDAGAVVAAGCAVLLTLGAVNAYLAGAVGDRRPGGAPWFLPAVAGSGALVFAGAGTGVVSVATAVTVPTAFFLVVYLVSTVAAGRILQGWARAAAVAAALGVIMVLAFSGWALVPAALLAVVAAVGRSRFGARSLARRPLPYGEARCATNRSETTLRQESGMTR